MAKSLRKGKAKPTLVTIGDNKIIPNGRWNNDVMADYVTENAADKYISIGHLAKVGCGSNTIPNKKRVRARLSSLFTTMTERGTFLAIEYAGHHNGATAVKLADLALEDDRQNVQAKLERMRKRKEMTEDQYARSMALLREKWSPAAPVG